ncbi:hypothetical protein GCM10023149_34950 [Mucilaginibacter gynuensis]|uniref:VanZ like protein n=2 Tax=Mucilaginibacter gynuensis TaxID=1302236 RepID=A0ABP8GU72_9SPHI
MGQATESKKFFPGFDKLVHCGLFFVFAVFCFNGKMRQQNATVLSYTTGIAITLAIIIFGGVIELLQLYVFTWRSADWNDLFADGVGTCMGAFSILITLGTVKYVKK